MKIRKSTVATIAGATALLAAGSVGGAFAGGLIHSRDIANGAVTNAKIAPYAVGGGKIMNNAIGANKLAPWVRTQLNTHAKNGTNGQDAFVGTQDFGNPTPGTGAVIANIGGSFATNATTVNSFHLNAGTYLINSSSDFERTSAAQSTDRSTPALQLAIRGDDGSKWGADYGTCFTGAFPASNNSYQGNIDQTCSASQLVTVPAGGITVDIKVFGYNANTSNAGSGNFQAFTDVRVVQINTN